MEPSAPTGFGSPGWLLYECGHEDDLLFSRDHPRVQPDRILAPMRGLRLATGAELKIPPDNARALFRL